MRTLVLQHVAVYDANLFANKLLSKKTYQLHKTQLAKTPTCEQLKGFIAGHQMRAFLGWSWLLSQNGSFGCSRRMATVQPSIEPVFLANPLPLVFFLLFQITISHHPDGDIGRSLVPRNNVAKKSLKNKWPILGTQMVKLEGGCHRDADPDVSTSPHSCQLPRPSLW